MDEKNNKVICPSCGSEAVTEIKKEKNISVTYSNDHQVILSEYNCSICGFRGDFTGENDFIVERAVEAANSEALRNILDYFTSQEISMAAFERAFEIPQRTLTKWKNGLSSPTAAGFALMNVVRTFPWMIEVAENKYDHIISKEIFLNHALHDMLALTAHIQGMVLDEVGRVNYGDKTWCYVRFSGDEQNEPCIGTSSALRNDTKMFSNKIKQITYHERT